MKKSEKSQKKIPKFKNLKFDTKISKNLVHLFQNQGVRNLSLTDKGQKSLCLMLGACQFHYCLRQ